jgi:hypothetical protein
VFTTRTTLPLTSLRGKGWPLLSSGLKEYMVVAEAMVLVLVLV